MVRQDSLPQIRKPLAVSALVAAALFAAVSESRAENPLGVKPAYTARELTPIPNAQAIERRIWLPGIDDGYVPQGIVFLNGTLFVSTYRSMDRKQDRGPCRLYALDTNSGVVFGHLDLPASCGHAGGLTIGRPGRLIVSDARVIFEIELTRSEAQIGRVTRSVKLSDGVKGSFAASEEDGFWLGQYERTEIGRIHKFPWAALAKKELTRADAIEEVAAPLYSQGATFDGAGGFWVMRSGSMLGELVRLDRKTSAVVERFQMPVGAEGISFESGGALWTLSEAGSRRWNEWKAFYPLALRFDPKLLK
jgi:hypothetical protein